jgi:hypothetical protein
MGTPRGNHMGLLHLYKFMAVETHDGSSFIHINHPFRGWTLSSCLLNLSVFTQKDHFTTQKILVMVINKDADQIK